VYAVHDERVLDVSNAVNMSVWTEPEDGTLSQIVQTAEPMIVNQLGEFYKNKNAKPSLLLICPLCGLNRPFMFLSFPATRCLASFRYRVVYRAVTLHPDARLAGIGREIQPQ